ncbi:MAG TPA: PilZ domain-containing protein [Sphingomicrobium sp.]|nr:PilZ domain-containing protein [Sphingomicrobium sp.]
MRPPPSFNPPLATRASEGVRHLSRFAFISNVRKVLLYTKSEAIAQNRSSVAKSAARSGRKNDLFTLGEHESAGKACAPRSESAIQTVDQPDRRRSNRAALRLSATMREAGRGRIGVRVIDMSTHGCRVETTSAISAETWIWLSIAGLETQYCRVVWRHQEFAGLEFATPLADAVFDRLLQDQNQLSENTISELRDIANRTHRLAAKEDGADKESLVELSKKCAVEAVVEGLRLGDGKAPGTAK